MSGLPARPVVLPSLMSADMLRLGEQLDALIAAGTSAVHVDVMDASFVPNLTVGPDWTRAIAGPVREAGGTVDVHLMVSRPGEVIGLDVHGDRVREGREEADPHPHRLLGAIRDAGCAAGLALNPGTPVEHVAELAAELDYVNVLAVNPGFAGQSFIRSTPGRVQRLRGLLPSTVRIEVDGGIGRATLPEVLAAGATMFVSASSIFSAPDPIAAYRELAGLAGG